MEKVAKTQQSGELGREDAGSHGHCSAHFAATAGFLFS